jgi:hypothetical protein
VAGPERLYRRVQAATLPSAFDGYLLETVQHGAQGRPFPQGPLGEEPDLSVPACRDADDKGVQRCVVIGDDQGGAIARDVVRPVDA